MGQFAELLEEVASTIMQSDPEDLPTLAGLHTKLQAISGWEADTSDRLNDLAPVKQRAGVAERLLERIILREANDTAAAMNEVSRTVTELINLAHSAMGTGTPPMTMPTLAAPATPAAPVASQAAAPADAAPAVSAPAQIEAERPVTAEDMPLVQEFIAEALSHLETAEAQLLALEADPDNSEAVNAIFRSFHTIKGVAGFLNLRQIGALSHYAENLLDLARKGELRLADAASELVLESVDAAKRLLLSLDAAAKRGEPPPVDEQLPRLLQRLQHCAATRGAESGAATPTVATNKASSSPAASAGEPAAPAQSKSGSSGDATVKVATDRLDALINMVGELVIAQSMVSQDVRAANASSQRLGRNMSHLGKITRELQDLSMSMRMVPIQGVFQKMSRLSRDLAKKSGKMIEFSVIGGETELDRNVVEAISDPLVHMVRNSADHGIEPPDDRERAGKPRAGRVQLRAFHQAGKIVIEISDDGRGLNKKKILKKAMDAGIVREGEDLTEQQIYQLIFHAGLSTADKITDVSGRGVGMDVVKKNVEALRGRIDIASNEGRGTTFSVHLPLTLAVIDGMIIRVGNERYIVPITSIQQSMRPKADQISTIQGRGEMLLVRGDLMPLFRLYNLFNVMPKTQDPTDALMVIVQDDLQRCCLMVDELLGQQQVVIKSLGEGIGSVPGVSGGAILGDGSISLILDVPGLIRLATGSDMPALRAAA